MSETLRQRALRLLAQRDHARVELKRKLAPHAESEEEVDALLDDLVARRLLSDARYAEMRVTARSGRYGNARLAQELRQQGVPAETAATALAEAGDEMDRARTVWRRKYAAPAADANERARQIRYLMQRGFSADIIRRLLRDEATAAAEREEE
jgi:regulatory protein